MFSNERRRSKDNDAIVGTQIQIPPFQSGTGTLSSSMSEEVPTPENPFNGSAEGIYDLPFLSISMFRAWVAISEAWLTIYGFNPVQK